MRNVFFSPGAWPRYGHALQLWSFANRQLNCTAAEILGFRLRIPQALILLTDISLLGLDSQATSLALYGSIEAKCRACTFAQPPSAFLPGSK